MEKDLFFTSDFDEKFRADYQAGNTQPSAPANHFDTAAGDSGHSTTANPAAARKLAAQVAPPPKALTPELEAQLTTIFDHPVVDFISTLYPEGAPEGSRHKSALKLASDLMIMLDGNEQVVRAVLVKLPWVQAVISERGEKEIDDILDSARKLLKKRESENYYELQPSKEMRQAIEKVAGRKYAQLMKEAHRKMTGSCAEAAADVVTAMLERIGGRLERLKKHFELMQLLCYRQKRRHYTPAVFVGGGFGMTLMTRMWYRFWAEPSQRCRLNSIVELIGRSGSGKHIAVFLYRLMMEPVKKSDAAQIDALNRWNLERDQKSGGEKNKAPRPTGILRCLPSEASAAAIREAEFNAKEMIDGEEWPLHVSQFNSELDDLLAQQKKGYMNIEALFLKSLHNEPAGSFLKTSSSMVGEYDVHFNGVYTGTEDALNKQNTTSNFARGLLQRLACVPMGDTNFEMRENRTYTEEDRQREQALLQWSYRLDSTQGEIPTKELSDALHAWTERRMLDAKEEDSKPLEDLVKRPCWIAINLALPFIVARHWDKMVDQDGKMVCGPEFKTDKIDRDLVLTLCDAQFAFQQHFFLATGEKLYEDRQTIEASNTHHQQKTIRAYRRLPDIFTSEDVDACYGYQGVKGSITSRLKRLQDDGLAQKIRSGQDKGKYRKMAS